MNNEDYRKNIERLKEIEKTVRDPESSLDKIDELIYETRRLVEECYGYTRMLSGKISALDDLVPDNENE